LFAALVIFPLIAGVQESITLHAFCVFVAIGVTVAANGVVVVIFFSLGKGVNRFD
jgi:hypothetical protein